MKRRILAIVVTLMMVINMMPANLLTSFALSADTSNADNSAKNKAQIGNHYDVSQVNGNKVKKADGSYETINRADYNTEAEYDAATAEKDRDDWRVKVNKTIEATGTENLFNVTLSVQTKEDIQENIISPDAAVVLVIDVSTSMKQCLEHGKVMRMFDSGATNPCSECNTLDKSRIYATQQAAQQFINNFAASDSNRQIAIVTFCRDAKVIQNWTSADNLATTSGVCAPLKIDTKSYNIYDGSEEWFNQKNLTMQSGTNIEGGLLLGRNVMSQGSASGGAIEGIDNKFVILLSDGAANACVVSTDDSKTYGKTNVAVKVESKYIYDQSNTATNRYVGYWGDVDYHFYHGGAVDVANEIKKSGMTLDTVYCGTDTDLLTVHDTNAKGVKQTGVDCDFCDAANAHWANSSNPDVTVPAFLQSFSDTYATAKNIDGLYKAFQDIEEKIEIATQAWKGADPMGTNGQFSGIVSETQDGEYTATSTNLIWDLLEAKPVITGKGTADETYTYSITYKVKLNTLSGEFDADTFYETNKPTELKYYFQPEGGEAGNLESIWFNIPTVQGYEGGYFKLIKVDENGNPLEQKAEFTISHTCNTCDICDDAPCSNCEKGTGEACASAWSDKAISGEGTAEDGTPLGVGFVSFHNIPSGHSYVLEETAAPSGFVKSDDKYKLTVSYGVVTVNELNEDGTVGDEVTGQLTVVNEEQKVTSISGVKTWEGDRSSQRPASVTINLYANGEFVKSTRTSADKNWAYSFEKMPIYDEDGNQIIYTVRETAIDNYYPEYDGYNYNINNVRSQNISVTVTKLWEGDDSSSRPESITVQLYRNGTAQNNTIELNEANNWTGTFTNLRKNGNYGTVYTYTVKETSVPEGYLQWETTGDASTGFYIKNIKPQTDVFKTSYTGTKTWVGDNENVRPENLVVKLYKTVNGTKTEMNAVPTWEKNDDRWTYTFKDLDVFDEDGNVISYSAEEITPVSKIEEAGTYTPEKTTEQASYSYKSGIFDIMERCNETSFEISKDDQDLYFVAAKPTSSAGTLVWTPRQATAEEESRIEATIKTEASNLVPTGKSDYIYIYGSPQRYTNSNGSYATFNVSEGESGNQIVELTFFSTSDWSLWGKGKLDYDYIPGSTDFTNTFVPASTELSVEKIWNDANNQDGYRPTSITVNVMRGDVKVAEHTLTAGEDGIWDVDELKHTFTGLPKYDEQMNEIQYTVSENDVPMYTPAVEEQDDGRFTITNTHVPELTSMSVIKVWDDENNKYGVRPSSIKVQLKANGNDIGDTITLNDSNKWAYTWTDLQKSSEGKEIVYTVEEVGASEEYTVDYTSIIKGVQITNTLKTKEDAVYGTATVTKVDSDNAPLDGAEFALKNGDSVIAEYIGGSFVISAEALAEIEGFELPEAGKTLTLKLVETKAPDGYKLSATEYDVVISATEKNEWVGGTTNAFVTTTTYTVTVDGAYTKDITNDKNSRTDYKHADATVTKVDQDGEALRGATFGLFDNEAGTGEAIRTYNAQTFEISTSAIPGEYLPEIGKSVTLYLIETDAPDGYTADKTARKVVIKASAEETLTNGVFVTTTYYAIEIEGSDSAVVKNTINTGTAKVFNDVTVTKVDKDNTATVLAGAEFALYDNAGCRGDAIKIYTGGEFTIDISDKAFEGKLPKAGKSESFYLKETKAPAGYDAIDTVYEVVVTAEESTPTYDPEKNKFITTTTYTAKINGKSDVEIENTITPAEIVLGVEKSLTGRSWENSDEFKFTLTSEKGSTAEGAVTMPEDSVVTVNKDAKAAEFGAIKFHKAGTYTFSVAETGKLPANVAQAAPQTVTVKVTMTERGLVAAVTSESGETLEFKNVYTPVPADVKLKATKVVTPAHDGQEYTLKAGSFKFKLTPSENNGPEDPLKITEEFTGIVTNDADGNIDLPAVEYTKAGTYVYTLQEVECNSPGMICDTSVYTITVVVEDDPATGKLSAAVTVDGEDKEIVFNNVYDPEETTALIHGTKTLGGGHKDLEADEFVFQLLDSEGEVIQEVKNTVTGIFQFEFEELTYDKTGVYEYTVVEKNLNEDGYTYDTKVYPVKVTVTDVDGALQAEVEGVMDGDESIIGFTNTYVPEAVKGNVSVSKELTGRDWTDNDKFTFRLTADGKYGNDVVMPENLEIIKTEGNDSTYSGAFDDITFKKVGTYKFNITEVNGGADGITYDNAQYTVEFVVVDADGKLSIKSVTYYDAEGKEIKASDVKFTNEYSAEGSVTLGAVKTVAGKELTDEVFTFELKDAKGTVLQTKTNAADGTITFDPISYTEADLGEHKYTISEVAGDNDKFSYSKDVYTVTVTVTDNGDGTLTAKSDHRPSAVKFVNTYTPAAASATLEGHKTLSGRDLNKGEFSFTMKPVNGAPMPEGVTSETVTNDADGNFAFSPITYDKTHAGNTYEYIISEVKGNLGGVTYDNSTITAKVTVGYDSNKGVLSTSVAYEPGEVEFANTYSAKDGEIVLGASKVLDGRALKAGEFSFELKDANGKVLQTKTNAADGTVTFDKLTYTEPGTYVYTISEVNDGAKGIGYDKTVHTVTVTVEDNLKGQLVAKADKAAAAVQFTNTYTPDPVEVSMNGNKVLDGRTLKAGEFSFELNPVDGAPMPEGKNPETVPNGADGTITFSSIVFDDDDAGKTYEYTIVEKSGDKAGVTYDKDTVSVFVTVTKDAETGDLSTSVKYQKANGKLSDGFTFKNSYKPEDSDGISVYANKTVVPQNGNSYEITGGEFRFEIIPGEYNPAGDPVVRGETTNDEDGSITAFEEAVYKAKGTYTYTLIELTGEKSGFSYDDHTFVITVKVTDDTENAKLVAAVDSIVKMSADGTEAPVNDIEFVNTYDPEKATANIHGHKTLNSTHKVLEAGEFTFQLLDEEGVVIEEVTNDINGVFHFSDIEYSTAGTYTYTIVEKNEGKPGYTYSDAEHVITVEVTDDNDGHLTAEVSGIEDENGNVIAEFVNGYEPEPVKINVGTEFSKTLDGRSMDEGEFTFVLMDGEDEIARATNDADGKFVFKNITFEKAGTYTYTISEVEGDKSGVTYDDAVYTVVFKVKDEVSDGDKVTAYGGQLKVDSVTYYDADGTKIDAADVVFENEYKAEGGIQLTAKKVLNGRTLKDGEFRFVLTDAEGNEQVKANDANGDIAFDTIKYDKAGTYTYVVKEVAGDLDNVTYSEEEYTVTVTVTDNRDGTLTAKADKDINDLVFTNTYTPDPVVVTDLGGIKTLEGRAIKAGEFSFTIEAAENAPLPEEATVACDKNGNFQFGKITYTKAGTYTYTISEDAGVVPGVTYDESEVTVVVTVTKDEITGVLSVTHEYQDAEGKALEKCTFKNRYEAEDTEPVSFTAVKAVEPTDGNSFTIKEGDFRFELTPAAGNPAADPLKDGVKTANKADGSVDFGNVQYEKAGTYVYTVREAAGDRGGITYDTSVYTITVKVTDDTAEAKLKAEVVITDAEGNVVEEMAFTNAYSPSETTALIYGHKYLDSEHKDLEAGEFSFEIKAVTENAPLPEETVVTNDAAGIFQFEFGEIKYTKPGTYEYEVVEVNQNETGYTYDDTVREVTVTVVDVNGELKATVEGVEDGSGNPLLTFNNEYVPEPEKVTIGTGFSKELNGRDLIAGEFTFQLRDGDTLIKEAVNDAEGNFVFEDLEFTKAGTYEYTVSEKESIAGGVESDTSVYNVKIVIEDKDGKLEATSVTYSDAEGNAIAETDVKFVNTYTASGDIQLGAAKLLKGKNLNAGDFMFELKDAEGNVIGTAVNEANGTVTFDPINYTEAGEYVYTISEANNAAANVTYDTAVYTVTVTVTDNGDGTLTAETDIPLTDITFVNTYTEPKKPTQTGDGFNGGLYGALALMAALTGAGVVFGRRRREDA